uniref:RNA-directed DNA polymerase, eukaryota, reverse transcriptase zinc-binding domain protein n=1 Tax=Tanacetum cinerariifolium TaxID=118510 RepID=A0A6L2K2U7_TANCI|nr:RNA-directed DNA polymerase, eukaryota, reverse transcriptase zinc-binding domain protein [Tanacetum cinerariifolium]
MAIDSFDDWISWITNLRLPSKHKSILEGVCYGLWWFIWAVRNKKIFGVVPSSKANIFDDLVISSFFWIGRAGNVGYTSICCDIIKEIDRMPLSSIESEQWDHLLDSLEGVMLNPSEDRWSWDLNGWGNFQLLRREENNQF